MYKNIILTIKDIETGIEAYINERLAGDYAVGIYDLDAEQYLPAMKIFKDKQDAIDYARKCTNSKGK